MDTVTRGNPITITVSVKDGTDLDTPLVTPTSAPTCTLTKPDGTAVFTDSAMTPVETGIYRLTHQTTSQYQLGTYKAKVKVISNSLTSYEVGYFQLVDEL